MGEEQVQKQKPLKIGDVTLVQAVKVLAETQHRVVRLEENQGKLLKTIEGLLKTIKNIDKGTSEGFKARDKALSDLLRNQKEIVKNTAPIVQEFNLYQNRLMEKMFTIADKHQKVDM